jgi:hypothetical protein
MMLKGRWWRKWAGLRLGKRASRPGKPPCITCTTSCCASHIITNRHACCMHGRSVFCTCWRGGERVCAHKHAVVLLCSNSLPCFPPCSFLSPTSCHLYRNQAQALLPCVRCGDTETPKPMRASNEAPVSHRQPIEY